MATNTSHYNLVKPAYTEPADVGVINGDMDLIDSALHDHDTALEEVESSIAIVATGNTHAAITSGQYVYVKEHTALADGLYTASTSIAANATLSSSNLTAVPGGGMNALKASVDTLNSNINTIRQAGAQNTYRVGRVVFVTVAQALNAGSGTLLTVPAGYKPTTWFRGVLRNTNGTSYGKFDVSPTNGEITYEVAAGGTYFGSATYITNDAYPE